MDQFLATVGFIVIVGLLVGAYVYRHRIKAKWKEVRDK